MNKFSDYIVYVDESGDHGLESIDPEYPLFVLCFCIFKKSTYSSNIIGKLNEIKFKYFGHDSVVMHSHDIRKKNREFSILNDRTKESEFISDINEFIKNSDFKIISSVIDKTKLKRRYSVPSNPYFLSLEFCLERLYKYLLQLNQIHLSTHIIVEARGKKEDDELELVFRRTIDLGTEYMPKHLPFEIQIAHKKTISTGMEIADLVAHPIGRKILKPEQSNRAFDLFEDKILRNAKSDYNGYGIKIFP
jgi:hypothetical protein